MGVPAGFKDFVTGASLPEGDLDNYLMAQTVMTFADVTARDAALTSPAEGMHAYLKDSDTVSWYTGAAWKTLPGGVTTAGDVVYFDGTSWVRLAVGTAAQVLTVNAGATAPQWATSTAAVEIGVAAGDETTVIADIETGLVAFRMPYAMTVTAVRASLTTADTTGITVDINEGGTTILSTKITFDASEKTTATAATPAVISDAALADDAEITVDVDAVGAGLATGLKVWLIGVRA